MNPILAMALAGALWTGGNTPPADMPPDNIYREVPSSAKSSVIADKFMVASAHHLASEAGAEILAAGGNAVDAGLAVQAALSVVEPESSGPGGGCFILFHQGSTGELYAMDGREEMPAAGLPDMFLDKSGGVLEEVYSGGLSVGVPGTVAAWSKMHARFGHLPLATVLGPAIRLAESGFPISPDLARAMVSERRRLDHFAASRRLYFNADGSPRPEGDIFVNRDLGNFFRLWADDPDGSFFYGGPLARAIVKTITANPFRPGRMRERDLTDYRAVFRDPIRGNYRGHEIAVFPPPTSGGITLLEILGIMETRPPLQPDPEDDAILIEHLDRLARASRIAFADRGRWLGDPDWGAGLPMRELLAPEFISRRAQAAFDPATDLTPPATAGTPEGRNTTHFSIVDGDGSMLSCTSTIEYIFGSAMVVPGYGFPLNNELTDFNLYPSVPPGANDIEGGRQTRTTALDLPRSEGGKRPRSSMCPIIVYDKMGNPAMALGSPGGSRIIGTVAGALLMLLDFDLGLQEAINFPRLHCRNRPVEIETLGWNREAVAEAMRKRGWSIAPLQRFPLLQGDLNAVRILPDGRREGASDPRRDGRAVGG
jgi:gamma-glutamyltranspeptidase / glutathione hydrolase